MPHKFSNKIIKCNFYFETDKRKKLPLFESSQFRRLTTFPHSLPFRRNIQGTETYSQRKNAKLYPNKFSRGNSFQFSLTKVSDFSSLVKQKLDFWSFVMQNLGFLGFRKAFIGILTRITPFSLIYNSKLEQNWRNWQYL